jgi:putative endonuclease
MKTFFVYILANKPKGTLYVGITVNLIRRIWEHKNKVVAGFTKTYHVSKLVYYEQHFSALSAIQREKRLKEWKRNWKISLIEKENPKWKDLYESLIV